jgi:hypothetical protein
MLTPSGGSSQTAFNAVNLPGYTEFPAYFGFGARTASSQTDNHWIDNVALDYATSKNCDRDGIHDDCEWVTMITSQPSSQGVCPGTTAVFQCAAAQPEFGYRWQKNGMPLNDGGNISGALTGTLNVSNAQTVDVGTYTCGVIDGCVTALSQDASLTISVAPGISGHPRELLHACAGNDASFSVSITGTPPFTCVWHRNGEVITGASTPILTLHGVSSADDESVYTCLVSNPCGSAWSNSGRLNVVPLPDFTLQPEDACGESGESVALSAAASAERAIYWQWWKDDVLVPGASGPTLPLDDLLTADAGLYSARAIITSPTFCTAWSDPAEVIVNGCPVCPAPGDLDGDGDWDLADAAEFARCLGPGGAWQPGCACANVNTDYNENVDLADWQMLLETWTGPTP